MNRKVIFYEIIKNAKVADIRRIDIKNMAIF